MDLGSGWFAGRQSAAGQLQRAAAAGFTGLALLPGDPPLRLDGWERARRQFQTGCRAGAFDALVPTDRTAAIAGLASADRSRQQQAWDVLPGALEVLAALGGRVLILSGGLDERLESRERGARLLARLRAGEGALAGDEALEEFRRAASIPQERQWEALARFVHAVRRHAPGLGIALAVEPSPAGLLTPGVLEQLLADPALAGVGYWHDCAVAEARADLGLEQPGAWLDAFGRRLLGVSLQDYAGGRDRLPPGEGRVDWRLLREYLPSGAARVLALAPSYPVEIAAAARTALAGLGFR